MSFIYKNTLFLAPLYITWPLQQNLGVSQKMQFFAFSQNSIFSEWSFLLHSFSSHFRLKPCQSCCSDGSEHVIQWTSGKVRDC